MSSEDDYEEATPEQKLSIATYFIMSSPVGEVDFVTADTQKLINDDSILTNGALKKILKDYNIEQMTPAKTPDNTPCLISSYGMVSDNEFVDPRSGKVLVFDHMRREFTAESDKKQDMGGSIEAQRAGVQKAIDEYIKERYKANKATAVVYAAEGADITICISAVNTKISSYWTGGWGAVFSFNPSTPGDTEMVGNVKVHVHYFEDGNVQLHTAIEKKITIKVSDPDDTGKSVAKAIDKIETDYQNALEEMYVDMHRVTFKEMRRFLPITKQPMEWNINAHGVGLKQILLVNVVLFFCSFH